MSQIGLASVAAVLWTELAMAASPVPSDGVITSSGEYYLARDRGSNGAVNVHIRANDVDLDLRGWTVRCTPDDPTTAVTFGVKSDDHNHVTVRNGSITGCYAGFSCQGAMCRAVAVDFSGNTYIGFLGGGRGTQVIGSAFGQIGGYSTEAYAIGVHNPGSDCRVVRNVFREIYRQPRAPETLDGEGVGVLVGDHTSGCVIRDNWFENQAVTPEIGIWVADDARALVTENTITNFGHRAIRGSVGTEVTNNRLWLKRPMPLSVGIGGYTPVASGNLIVGFEIALDGVRDDANLILPSMDSSDGQPFAPPSETSPHPSTD